ncbi:phage tail tape measure protein [Spirosoma pomorum]
MAINLNETATLTLKSTGGKDLDNELAQLNKRATELKTALNEIEKGGGKKSERWKELKNELAAVNAETAKLHKEVDISTLSYGQLENYVKRLAKELKTLKPGTDEFNAAAAKLQNARQYLDQVTASTKATSTASKQAAKDLTGMADSGLLFGELKTKIDQLKAKLETLPPETQEFIDTAKQLGSTTLYYNQIDKSVKELSTSTKKATDDLTDMADAGLTFGQLKTKIEQLKAKLDTLNPTSKEFIETSKKLASVEGYYDNIRNAVDDATTAMHKQLLEAKNSELTYGQLETKVKLLADRLTTLTPGTEEFIKATKELYQTKKDFDEVNTKMEHVLKTGEEMAAPTLWDRIKARVSGLSLVATASFVGIGMAIKDALTTAVTKFAEFDEAAADMSAVTGITGEGLDYLKQRAMETGPAFGKSAAEMMEAYKLLAAAKPELAENAEALASVTDQAIKLSKAGKIDLAEAAKLVAESLNQWGKGADNAAEYVNVLAAGSQEGSAEMNDLSSSLKYAGTVAAAAGISFTQTNAILQSLSIISIKGEQAGTGLRTMLVKLMSGARDTNPAIVGLDKALENLEKKNLSTSQMVKLFGQENLVTARHVITHREQIAQMTKNMTGTNEATTQAKTNMATLSETIKQGTATVTNYAVSWGEKLAPSVSLAIQYGLAFLKVLAAFPQVLVENRGLVLGLVTGLVAFNAQLIIASVQSLKVATVEKIRAAASSLAAAADKIRTAEAARKAAAEALSTAATEAGTVAENAATAATGRRTLSERLQAAQATIMTALDKGRVIVTNALTIAQNALNAAWRANPVGIVIGVLTILGGTLYTLYESNVKVRAAFSGLWAAMKEGVNVIVRLYQAVKSLNFGALAAEMTMASHKIANAFTKGYDERIAAELPKSAKKAGTAAGKALTETHQAALNTMTADEEKAQKKREQEAEKARKKALKEQDKHLEDVRQANEKALEDLAKLEADAHIAGIKDEMQREFAKLMAKHDLEAQEIQRGLQDVKLKNQQIANLNLRLEGDIARVAAEFAEKKRKKAEEEEQKRLETMKNIAEQERQAKQALLDWEEIKAKNNADKLADIHLRRVKADVAATINKLNAEENAEVAKAKREITDKNLQEQTITAIEARYINERILAEAKGAAEKEKIEKELKAKKNAIWTETSSAFSALLKGDLMGFVEHADKIVTKEKEAWQKRLQENMAKYEAVAQLATAAVQFLNKLEQDKANRAIEEAKRERDEKVRLLNDLLAAEKAAQDVAEAEKQRVTQESNDKIAAIKSATESTISSLEQQYRQLSSSAEKKKLDEQIQGYKENAEGKSEAARDAASEAIEAAQDEAKQSIEAAQKAEKATIQAATNEKNQKIDAAEAARDAEIAAINKRKDVDQETRTKLLAEAKQAFETAKQQATDEATAKIDAAKDTAKAQTDLAKDTAKTKIDLAKDQQDAELKAIEAIQKGDEKAAKEILTNAKEDQKEKIRLAKEEADKKLDEAEREKREKLKKVEAEKQTRIQNQKELNRQIEAENKRAADAERAAKQKAWKAQQDADVKSALIAGALAAVKALASGFFPLNLAFAAATAIATALQVRTIRGQSMPSFEHGGFIAQGGRHGSTYGTGGIALIDRRSRQEVGEMEGNEAIISQEQTKANLPIIQRMFANARTPGRRSQPVIDRNALGFKDGGMLQPESYQRPMFLYGGIPTKPQPRRRYDDGGVVDYDSSSSDGGAGISEAEAREAGEAARKQGEEQLKLLNKIVEGIDKMGTDQRQGFTTLSADLRLVLINLVTDLATQLSDIRTGQQTGFDQLNTTLRSTLLSMVLTQRADNADLVNAILKGSDKTSQDIVRAIDTNGNANRLSMLGLSLKVGTGFTESTGAMVKAMDTHGAAERLALLSLTLALKDSLAKLQEQGKQDAAKLTKTTQDGFEQLIKRGDSNLDDLTTNIEFFLDTLGNRTERVINTTSRAEQQVLDKLSTTTRTSLDTLNKDQKQAIGRLSDDVIRAVELLSQNTTQALDTLGDRTDAALTDSANRTTRSVDGLSIEVRSLKGSINAVEGAVYQVRGAVNGVEGAVYNTNQAGRLDALIAGISTFGGK